RFAPNTIAWGSAGEVTKGTCATPIAGSTVGQRRTCTVTGLSDNSTYQFQLVAYRGTLNVNAVFGGLSNIVSAKTGATIPAAVTSVSVSPTTAALVVGATRQFTAAAKDSAGNTLSGRVISWASSAPGIATVSSGGLVTGVAAGSAT